VLFAAAVIAVVAAIGHDVLMRPATDVRIYKSVILPPAALSDAPALRLQVSPDGRRLAFVAPDDAGRTLLWVRPLDGFAAQALNGTVNAVAPFWSADSRWLAFLADGKLKKIEIASGTITTLCDAMQAPPGSWNRDDVIIFTSANGLSRVPAAGGKPEPLTRLAAGERTHISPFFLPDGHHFLYTASAYGARRAGVFAGSLDSAEATRLLDESTNAVYADRRLLFLRDRTLMAQPFDPDARRLSGAAVPIAEAVLTNFATGTGAFSVSQSGVLVYQTGNYAGTQLVWYDRSGHALGTLGEPKGYRDVQMSADGRFVSVTASTAAQSRVWVFDVLRNLGRPFTFGNEVAQAAVWTPDGQSIIYSARRGASFDLFRRSSTGGDSETLLLHDDFDKLPLEVTADGRTLLYRIPRAAASGELWLLPLTGERKPRALAPGNADQVPAAVSPDGRWLAYVVNEGPRPEVYVTSFPDGNGKWLVSSDGGDNPRWRADGKELFFAANDRLLAVDVTTSANQFAAGPVKELFTMRVPASALGTRATYAPSPDGQKFLVNTYDQRAEVVPITLVVNWANGLPK
jgi:Tol biopolymer transport system component